MQWICPDCGRVRHARLYLEAKINTASAGVLAAAPVPLGLLMVPGCAGTEESPHPVTCMNPHPDDALIRKALQLLFEARRLQVIVGDILE